MSLKRELKEKLPRLYAIYNIIKNKPGNKKNIWQGVYKCFSDISDSTEYNVSDTVDEIYEAHLAFYNEIADNAFNISSEETSIHNLLPLLISTIEKDTINVVDYGGAMGVSFSNVLNKIDAKNLYWQIIDLPETINKIKEENFYREKNIVFKNSLKEVDNKTAIDIFHLGSSLQYVENYRPLIEEIGRLKPKYIFVSHTTLSLDAETFVTQQVNMANRKIRNWMFNFEELNNDFLCEGTFELIFKSTAHHYPWLHFDNFDPRYRNFRYASLLYKNVQR